MISENQEVGDLIGLTLTPLALVSDWMQSSGLQSQVLVTRTVD